MSSYSSKANFFLVLTLFYQKCQLLPQTHNLTPTHTLADRTTVQTSTNKLTIDLVLRLCTPSAASPEEVWGIVLLHKDPLHWTCGGSRRCFSSQCKGIKVEGCKNAASHLVDPLHCLCLCCCCCRWTQLQSGPLETLSQRQNVKHRILSFHETTKH